MVPRPSLDDLTDTYVRASYAAEGFASSSHAGVAAVVQQLASYVADLARRAGPDQASALRVASLELLDALPHSST